MSNYCLFFAGEIHENFELEAVKAAFKAHLNLSDIEVERYFFGNEVTVQSHLTQMEALALIVELEEIGGVCYFLPMADDIELPEGVLIDRRYEQRRKKDRRHSYRTGLYSDRRVSGDRRKAVHEY